jgi:hypothetical protein
MEPKYKLAQTAVFGTGIRNTMNRRSILTISVVKASPSPGHPHQSILSFKCLLALSVDIGNGFLKIGLGECINPSCRRVLGGLPDLFASLQRRLVLTRQRFALSRRPRPLLARLGPSAMSAFRSLSGVKRTLSSACGLAHRRVLISGVLRQLYSIDQAQPLPDHLAQLLARLDAATEAFTYCDAAPAAPPRLSCQPSLPPPSARLPRRRALASSIGSRALDPD